MGNFTKYFVDANREAIMQKFLSYLFMVCVSVALQVLVFIYGWGMHPRSWWWIIGGGVVASTLLRSVFDAVEKENKKSDEKKVTR